MGGHFFETLVQDVRFAVRILRKSRFHLRRRGDLGPGDRRPTP